MNNYAIILEPNEIEVFSSKIQEAIDLCFLNGGGKIILKNGVHRSKPIILKSNIELNFENDATLIFSNNFSEYNPVFTRWEGTECFALRSMIFAENSSNIKISGPGVIDGLGDKWWNEYKNIRSGFISPDVKSVMEMLEPLNKDLNAGSGGGGIETNFLRPSLLQFKNCQDCTIQGVTLQNSAFWNTHILYCDNVLIDYVKFKNPSNAPNTDGLDIDSSSNITVSNCNFDVGDDCLCLKSGMDEDGIRVGKSTNNVNIYNCHMNNGHGGVVIGSETSGGIENITIKNCHMVGTDRGIRVKTRRGRGGTIKNIDIKNIKMDMVICPVVMNMYYRCGADNNNNLSYLKSLNKEEFYKDTTPKIEDISIVNLTATRIKSCGLFFYGIPESPIKNLKLVDIKIDTEKTIELEQPAMDFFDTIPKEAVFLRNVEKLITSNICIDNKNIGGLND